MHFNDEAVQELKAIHSELEVDTEWDLSIVGLKRVSFDLLNLFDHTDTHLNEPLHGYSVHIVHPFISKNLKIMLRNKNPYGAMGYFETYPFFLRVMKVNKECLQYFIAFCDI